ncbi:hypothetical protein ECDEC12B_2063 [Escherichia coli DEC12B]|nr:hypothetical protein ECDEC12B_2063 [Escherichia coli DEC12B]
MLYRQWCKSQFFSVMDSDQELPVIRSTMPVLFCQSCHISFPYTD